MLAVSVRANHQPENEISAGVRNHNPIVQTAQPKDTQQTPCSIAVWTSCGGTGNIYIPDTHGIPCELIAIAYAVSLEKYCF